MELKTQTEIRRHMKSERNSVSELQDNSDMESMIYRHRRRNSEIERQKRNRREM